MFQSISTGLLAAVILLAPINAASTGADHAVCELRLWLATQEAVPEVTVPYSRAEWPHWVDEDKDCQDSRQEAIIRAGRQVQLVAGGCKVQRGEWLDPYTDKVFTDPAKMDVDHVVPLKEAAESGGQDWPREVKEAFANDLTTVNPQLLAVSAAANRSKGAKDPAEWLPSVNRCGYAANWVAVKKRWNLTMDALEKDVLAALLKECTR